MDARVPPLKMLRASAGSGKTFALTVHYLSLLLNRPSSYKEILALTFTNKATAEMKSRILGVLRALAKAESEPGSQVEAYLHALLQVFTDWKIPQIQERAVEAYRKILHDYSRFSVSTIDAFSQQVIRGFSYELGLDGAFRVELNLEKVKKDLIQRLYLKMNEQQALLDWMLERILAKVEEDKSWNVNADLSQLAGVIFSDEFRGWEEVLERNGQEHVFTRTAQFSREWVKQFEDAYIEGVRTLQRIFDESDVQQHDLTRKSQNPLLKLAKFADPAQIPEAMKAFGTLAGNMDAYQTAKRRSPQVEALFARMDPELARLQEFLTQRYPTYLLVKSIQGNIHYLRLLKVMADSLSAWRHEEQAQLISDAQHLLRKIGQNSAGDPSFIWEKMGSRYRYFLFDEFQDTSFAQWDNLLPLLLNALGTAGGRLPEHLIVGDVKQSIYRWRGGDFRILLEGVERAVEKAFHLPPQDTGAFITKESLDTNFRSAPEIIRFNNYLYRVLPAEVQAYLNQQVEKELPEAHYVQAWQGRGLDTTVLRAYEGSEQVVPAHRRHQPAGSVFLEFLRDEEAVDDGGAGILGMNQFRARACERVYEQLCVWFEAGKYHPGDVGILVRSGNEAKLLIDYIRYRQAQGGLIFPVLSGDALLLASHACVKTLAATLRYMAFEGAAYNTTLAELVLHFGRAKQIEIPVEAWLAVGNGHLSGLSTLLPEALIRNWETWKQLPLPVLVDTLIACFEFGGESDPDALPYLLGFRDLISKLALDGRGSISQFFQFWEEEKDKLPLPEGQEAGAVEILTIHKSKGLAFPVVMLPFCTWDLQGKWSSQVWFDVRETEFANLEQLPLPFRSDLKYSAVFAQYFEEQLYFYMDALNTLYVGTTRAREVLWMLAPDPVGDKDVKELKNLDHIGKFLYKVLREAPSGLFDPLGLGAEKTDQFASISPSPLKGSQSSYPDSHAEEARIKLSRYTSSAYLHELLLNTNPTPMTADESKAAAFGSALHELMARVDGPESLEKEVERLLKHGMLATGQADRARQMIHQAWAHPQLGQWLRGPYQVANERAIVDQQGQTWRPDKVFFGERETHVVDFKLSPNLLDPKHVDQLRRYVKFLRNMHFPRVKGYLYYFLQDELIELHEEGGENV